MNERVEMPSSTQTTANTPTPEPEHTGFLRSFMHSDALRSMFLPALAVFTALLIGAVIIAAPDPDVLSAWGNFFQDPVTAITTTWFAVFDAYISLFEGSFGNPVRIVQGFITLAGTGQSRPLLDALRPLGESLVIATPYIFAGLACTGARNALLGPMQVDANTELFLSKIKRFMVIYGVLFILGLVFMVLGLDLLLVVIFGMGMSFTDLMQQAQPGL